MIVVQPLMIVVQPLMIVVQPLMIVVQPLMIVLLSSQRLRKMTKSDPMLRVRR
jgi:hypothetical protein